MTTIQQPPLRPDPGLPQIPFPADLPRILGPLLGTTTPGTTPDPSAPATTTPRRDSGSGAGASTTSARPTD
ncbi:hypothetical protein ABZ319_31515 [Nocardia sp. NPDC005978]|uniref:hypothetical protein n=1 Tax=Nocardia sp. NPDC005978 TaxID=3156725 RepID=UPI0033BF74B8